MTSVAGSDPDIILGALESHGRLYNGKFYAAEREVGHDPALFSPFDTDIEVPAPASALLERLLKVGQSGDVIYLCRYGQRLAAVLPADVAESIEREPLDPVERKVSVAAVWVGWRRAQRQAAAAAASGSAVEMGIATGAIEPPREPEVTGVLPELASLTGLFEALMARREQERRA